MESLLSQNKQNVSVSCFSIAGAMERCVQAVLVQTDASENIRLWRAISNPVRLLMGRIDHQQAGVVTLERQRSEYPPEHPESQL
jgi:hypothetical protein